MTDKGKLLIVDDEFEILELMQNLLQDDGFSVLTAESGKQALALLNETSIDVMITDIRMPGMDGIELLVAALQVQPDLQCIVATGHGDINSAIRAMETGAINYFQKPININEVVIAVEHGMEKLKLRQKVRQQTEEILSINAELTLINEKLEQRVAERTVAMKEINRKLMLENKIRQKTEVRLRKREKQLDRLAMALENAVENVMITDPAGNIEYVNPAFEKITGYSQSEVLGKNPRFLQSGMHERQFYSELWKTINAGNKWHGLVINMNKEGKLIQEESTISPILDSSHRITGYVSVKRDITEQVKLEEMLRQAQKMEAIGTLAGGIAHDFNNILSIISGFAQLAKDEIQQHNMDTEDIDEVINASKRAIGLVQQILTLSRQSELKLQPIRIQYIIKEALKFLRPTISKSIEIVGNIDMVCPPVLADSTEVHQIIMNLATNAYYAMQQKGGILEISLAPVELDRQFVELHFWDIRPGLYVQLTVSDTGFGIDKENIDKMFEPYFTTKKKGEGTGLGLALVYGIVTGYKGHVFVESEPEKGTTVRVYLPAYRSELYKEEQRLVNNVLPHGTERIMVVDDEKPIIRMIERTLSMLGYKVTAFTDSIEALGSFAEKPDSFDLIISDINLPKMMGTELARDILQIRPDIPIILCTGYSEKINPDQAVAFGIRKLLYKPVERDTLAVLIRNILDGMEEEND